MEEECKEELNKQKENQRKRIVSYDMGEMKNSIDNIPNQIEEIKAINGIDSQDEEQAKKEFQLAVNIASQMESYSIEKENGEEKKMESTAETS